MRRNILIFSLFLLLSSLYFVEVFGGHLLLATEDGLIQIYPVMGIMKEQYLSGRIPFWNSYMFSGFPMMAASQYAVLYPPFAVLVALLPPDVAYNADVILHIALAGFFTYLCARRFGAEVLASFIGGAAFAFSGYLVFQLYHLPIIHTAVWMPLIFYFIEGARASEGIRGALKASFAIALQIFAGHPQVFFYTWLMAGLYLLVYIFSESKGGRARFVGLVLLAFSAGAVMASPQLYATYELSSLGVRAGANYDFFSSYSHPISDLKNMLFPLLSASRVGYVGVMVLLCGLSALIAGFRESAAVRFWGIAAIVTLVLSLGSGIEPLHRLMFHVPLYNKFRGVSKHLLETALSLSILAAVGITYFTERARASRFSGILGFLFMAVPAAAVGTYLMGGTGVLLRPAIIIPLAVMIVSAISLVVVIKTGRYAAFRYFVMAVVIFEIVLARNVTYTVTADADAYGKREFTAVTDRTERAAFFSMDVIATFAMRQGIRMVDGYDPMIPGRYAELLGMGGVGGLSMEWSDLVQNNLILSMLGARYIYLPLEGIFAETLSGTPWDDGGGLKPLNGGSSTYAEGTPLYRRLDRISDNLYLYENLNAMPRTFSVKRLSAADGIDGVKARLYSLDVNPRVEAMVSGTDLASIGKGDFGVTDVRIQDEGNGWAVADVEGAGEGFVVLSEQYHPGWRATVDGSTVPLYRTDGVLMGAEVPQGRHTLRFEYTPVRIYALTGLSAVFAGLIMVYLYRPRRAERG